MAQGGHDLVVTAIVRPSDLVLNLPGAITDEYMTSADFMKHPINPYAPWCWYIYLQNWVIKMG